MRHGFSLVELSIVLVILGLLTGGILAGQSLIRAAELRSVAADAHRYTTAIYTFRDKYFAGPGDMATATKFWGKDAAACSSDPATAGTPGTCNGNGDGALTYGTAPGSTAEPFQAWKQLALAGLVEGNYSGLSGATGANEVDLGVNIPRSKIPNASWYLIRCVPGVDCGAQMFRIPQYGNFLTFGTKNGTTGGGGKALKPEEAWNIDTKMDDGRPAQGKVIGKFWNNECTTPNTGAAASTNLDASYLLTETSIQCALHFIEVF